MGLPIVAEIAAAHGGSVRLQSVPGVTTVFEIVLPLDEDCAA